MKRGSRRGKGPRVEGHADSGRQSPGDPRPAASSRVLPGRMGVRTRAAASRAAQQGRQGTIQRVLLPSCGSLEETKRRATSHDAIRVVEASGGWSDTDSRTRSR
jgi:hypothetical protein